MRRQSVAQSHTEYILHVYTLIVSIAPLRLPLITTFPILIVSWKQRETGDRTIRSRGVVANRSQVEMSPESTD